MQISFRLSNTGTRMLLLHLIVADRGIGEEWVLKEQMAVNVVVTYENGITASLC